MPFWKTKTLDEMNQVEWESLCDGCGRCCLMKLEDEDSGQVVFTSVACKLLNCDSCACHDYAKRTEIVEDCIQLTPESVRAISWLPKTCAYRLINEGKPLYKWHPLISGSKDSVHTAGISVRGRITKMEHDLIDLHELENHLVNWPMKSGR